MSEERIKFFRENYFNGEMTIKELYNNVETLLRGTAHDGYDTRTAILNLKIKVL